MPMISLTASQRRQIGVWKSDLDRWLASTGNITKSENLISRSDMEGLSIVSEAKSQRDLYDFLIRKDGVDFLSTEILSTWRDCARYIRGTYNVSHEMNYDVEQGISTKRSEMRDLFDSVLVAAGESSSKPTLKEI